MIRVPSILDVLAQSLWDGIIRSAFRVFDQRYVRRRPATPGAVRFLSHQSEVHMALFEVTASLPVPAKADDVSSRKITLAVDGGEPTSYDVDPAALTFVFPTPFAFNQVLTGTLVDTDAAGNPSEPSSFSYTVLDTTPPPTPGELGFESRQVD